MNELLHNLVEALREELKQYGEMLALLDHQHEFIVHRKEHDFYQSLASLDTQAEAIRAARQEREQRRRHLARTLRLDDGICFKALTPYLPAEYRPLLKALVLENHDLLLRVQQRARQNHVLLDRSLERMQRLINSLRAEVGFDGQMAPTSRVSAKSTSQHGSPD